MKITKSELKEIIMEVIMEELPYKIPYRYPSKQVPYLKTNPDWEREKAIKIGKLPKPRPSDLTLWKQKMKQKPLVKILDKIASTINRKRLDIPIKQNVLSLGKIGKVEPWTAEEKAFSSIKGQTLPSDDIYGIKYTYNFPKPSGKKR